jgi:hypothetical protein
VRAARAMRRAALRLHVGLPGLSAGRQWADAIGSADNTWGAIGRTCDQWRTQSSFAEDDEKLGRPTTPWVRQVISGVDLMRHPKYNKVRP